MKFLSIFYLLAIIVTFNYAMVIKPIITQKKIQNAHTLLVQLKSKNISEVRLSLNKRHIPFYKNPFQNNSFYALLPLSYYDKKGNKKAIISYVKNKKRVFTSVKFKLIEGKYQSETINVDSKKVSISEKVKIRTKKEYQEAMHIYNSKTPTIYWEEKFIKPLQSKITSRFGTKRLYNKTLKSYHSGVDYKAAVGTPIKASNSGLVRLVKNRFYSGNSIIIDHGQGIYTCYFHLSQTFVKAKQIVKKGEILGLSGKTGRVTGPHLHFSARVHGIQVAPQQLISILNTLIP